MRGSLDGDSVVKAEACGTLTVVADICIAPRGFSELKSEGYTLMVMTESSERHKGRKDKLLGAIGTISNPLTPFCRMGPPAEREQAVDPVGVEMRRPSPNVSVTYSPLTQITKAMRLLLVRIMQISLRQIFSVTTFWPLSWKVCLVCNLRMEEVANSSLRGCTSVLSRATMFMTRSISVLSNRHMNPKVPLWKVIKGGGLPRNSLAAQSIVPSPPTHTTQSISRQCVCELNQMQTQSQFFAFILIIVFLSMKKNSTLMRYTRDLATFSMKANTQFSSQILPTVSIRRTGVLLDSIRYYYSTNEILWSRQLFYLWITPWIGSESLQETQSCFRTVINYCQILELVTAVFEIFRRLKSMFEIHKDFQGKAESQ